MVFCTLLAVINYEEMIKYLLIKLLKIKIDRGIKKRERAYLEGDSIYVSAYTKMIESYEKALMFVESEQI